MIDSWMEDYIAAWRSDDPAAVTALFTEDARYYATPYRPPKTGRDEIARWWVSQRDSKTDWTFEYTVLVDGAVSVVRGVTSYPASIDDTQARTYHNLWVIHLEPDGRASEFVEFWMREPDEAA